MKRPPLVVEDLQHQPGVQLRVVQASLDQGTVLVVLDQVVVGVAGEGEGVQPEGVHRGQIEQPQVGIGGLQVGQVEVDQIVPQQEVRAICQLIQPGQRLVQV